MNLFVNCWLKLTTVLDNVYLGTGHHQMASLTACHTCSPAEDLQPPQASGHHAHRARKRKPSLWHLGSWIVRSMVESREPLTEKPAKDEDSALLAPSSLRRTTWPDLAVDRQDRTGCKCECSVHMADIEITVWWCRVHGQFQEITPKLV